MKVNALIALIPSVVMFSCGHHEESKKTVEKYTVTNPIVLDTTYTKEYVSQIKSFRNIELRAQEKGYLDHIYVDEGQYVHAGQLLFRIMPKLYEAEYDKAKAEVEMAQIEFVNASNLSNKNIVSINEANLAKAKLDQAKAEMAIAKVHLGFTEIRAPFDGVIDRIPLRLGALVEEGELLTNLSDNSHMQVYFNVSEPEYLDYQNNVSGRAADKISLKLANNDIYSSIGKVELVESEFNNETGNIAFRAKFPNPKRLLKHGQTGKVLMEVPLRHAVIIPQKSTYELQDRKYVFIVNDKGIVKSKMIHVSSSLNDLYVVESGLAPSDIILLDGVQKVHDDDQIKADFKNPKLVLADLRLKAE